MTRNIIPLPVQAMGMAGAGKSAARTDALAWVLQRMEVQAFSRLPLTCESGDLETFAAMAARQEAARDILDELLAEYRDQVLPEREAARLEELGDNYAELLWSGEELYGLRADLDTPAGEGAA